MLVLQRSRTQVWPRSLQHVGLLFLFSLVWCAPAGAQTSTFTTVPGTTWAARFDGPARHTDRSPVMTIDSHGGVYVAAETRSLTDNPEFATTPEMDIVTIRYDSSG